MGSISEIMDALAKETYNYKTAMQKCIIENKYDTILKHRDRVDKLGLRAEQFHKSLYDISKMIEAAIGKFPCELCLHYNFCYHSEGSELYKESCLLMNKKEFTRKEDNDL